MKNTKRLISSKSSRAHRGQIDQNMKALLSDHSHTATFAMRHRFSKRYRMLASETDSTKVNYNER